MEIVPLHTYSQVSMGEDRVTKLFALPPEATRALVPDMDAALREQLFHALVDHLDIPGIVPLDFPASYQQLPAHDRTSTVFSLSYEKERHTPLSQITSPAGATEVILIGQMTARTLLDMKSRIEHAYPAVRFGGHNDLKPEHIFPHDGITDIIDWQSYELANAVPDTTGRMYSPDYGSMEHLMASASTTLNRDTVSLAKILLRLTVGVQGYPVNPASLQCPDAPKTDTRIVAVKRTPIDETEVHSRECLRIIEQLISSDTVLGNDFFGYETYGTSDIDTHPALLTLLHRTISSDIQAFYGNPETQPVGMEEFLLALNELGQQAVSATEPA